MAGLNSNAQHEIRFGSCQCQMGLYKLTKAEVNLHSRYDCKSFQPQTHPSKEQNSSIYKITNDLVTPKHHVATPTLFDANR